MDDPKQYIIDEITKCEDEEVIQIITNFLWRANLSDEEKQFLIEDFTLKLTIDTINYNR